MEKVNRALQDAFSLQSSYCYPDSNVLVNKIDCHDNDTLQQYEAAISTYCLTLLHTKAPIGNFDVNHYLAIHRFLFGEIYPFAGKFRMENISKSNLPYYDSVTPFCRPEFIHMCLDENLKKLHAASKKWQSREEMIKDLAYYYSEINVIHPFREGNGRTQREFFRELVAACKLPYCIDYSKVEDKNLLIKGSIISALTGKCELIEAFFDSCIVELELKKSVRK